MHTLLFNLKLRNSLGSLSISFMRVLDEFGSCVFCIHTDFFFFFEEILNLHYTIDYYSILGNKKCFGKQHFKLNDINEMKYKNCKKKLMEYRFIKLIFSYCCWTEADV